MVALIIGSVIYIVLFFITGYFVSQKVQRGVEDEKVKREYRNMAWGLSFLGIFMMWLMWISVYLHQMNPLIEPILDKEIVEHAKHSS